MPEPETPLAERPWEDVDQMVDVDEALRRILGAVSPLPATIVPTQDALGMVLAAPIVAGDHVPPFENSAMDGFAVVASDTSGADSERPVTLSVIGEVAAGMDRAPAIKAGQAVRIMTGAPMPAGSDAVVRFEETDEEISGDATGRGRVAVRRAARRGDNVRPAGEDMAAGATILASGTRLRPFEIGVLAALGRVEVAVHRRPRVAIISTGDEVVEPGAPRGAGQIWDSNRWMVAAMVRTWGGEPELQGIAADRFENLAGTLKGARGADLIVTSGGVSLGDYDLVKDVLRAEGDVAIWQVRMKPGKPLAFGRIGATPLLGLPGNPVAAAVSLLLFGRPVILRLLGRSDLEPPMVEARLLEAVENRGQRRHFARVVVRRGADGGWEARPAGAQGAGVLTSLARANGLLVVPERLDEAAPGMRLPVLLLDNGIAPG